MMALSFWQCRTCQYGENLSDSAQCMQCGRRNAGPHSKSATHQPPRADFVDLTSVDLSQNTQSSASHSQSCVNFMGTDDDELQRVLLLSAMEHHKRHGGDVSQFLANRGTVGLPHRAQPRIRSTRSELSQLVITTNDSSARTHHGTGGNGLGHRNGNRSAGKAPIRSADSELARLLQHQYDREAGVPASTSAPHKAKVGGGGGSGSSLSLGSSSRDSSHSVPAHVKRQRRPGLGAGPAAGKTGGGALRTSMSESEDRVASIVSMCSAVSTQFVDDAFIPGRSVRCTSASCFHSTMIHE